ncbi:ClpXP adapter SpxH family protein [Metabacillus malikii]|uniref:ClpXP adapter protein SpxH n=1 Tax=Metabacillus malikii TaxID=1504265 RepID=A0ABT9ZEF7_9BACI|nr:ClpXP adapter SpxH family protein [Metabacillus malikii]MDQ0230618.1 putative DsbA family dithiol-disulfide isomerase [Metabacillus malikii]
MNNNCENKDHNLFFSHCNGHPNKPLEIYMFVDPLCPDCWALEPIIKKLQIEYGRLFTLRHILSGKLATLNITKRKRPDKLAQAWEKTASRTGMSCDGKVWLDEGVDSPFTASLAIKAAELQGRKAGLRFLRKLQETLFIESKNVSKITHLISIAEMVGLDVTEFERDIHSHASSKAFQCDLKITSEMNVSEIPTLAFFSENVEEEGIIITGVYSYDMYVNVLQEMIGKQIKPSHTPPLEAFLQHYQFVASAEIALVYNMTLSGVEKELKKLILSQKVEKVQAKHGTFWRYLR